VEAPPLAELVRDRDRQVVIVVGRAGVAEGDRTPFGVERQYFGPALPPAIQVVPATVRLPDGTSMVNTCGIDLVIGRRMFLVMSVEADGSFGPSTCLPAAPADEPAGEAYIAEAIAAFGGGVVPSAAATDPPIPIVSPDTPASPAPDAGVVGAGPALAAALVLALGLALLARRRRAGTS
jgi:hypothetical protein